MDELHAVFHFLFLDVVQCFQEFGAVEAELAVVSAGFFPLAAAGTCQLDANADVRAHADTAGKFHHQMEFVHLLDDDENLLAHLLREEGELDKILVLVAVADDEGVGIVHIGKHRVEFGLGTGLETDVELFAVAHHLFKDRALLVHLDGENAVVTALEAVFLAGLVEALVNLLDAAVQDIREAEQHRSGDVAERKFLHQVVQVDVRAAFLEWVNCRVALLVDVEEVHAPTLDIVQVTGIVNAPFFHCSESL